MNISNCPFCIDANHECITAVLGSVYSMRDLNPVTEGHLLIIPFRHTADFFSMTRFEQYDALELADTLRQRLLQRDPTVSGFNLGVNCGEAAGQTIQHAHVHLIPRRVCDTSSPQGGVRCVVP